MSRRGRTARTRRALRGGALAAAFLWLGGATPAAAHGFGQRYDLPVPLGLYVAGAAAAVAFSFIVIGVFVRGLPRAGAYPRLNLLPTPVGRLLARPAVSRALRATSAALLLLVVLTGFLGDQYPVKN